MLSHIYEIANRLQRSLLEAESIPTAPRVALDGWASLQAWNQAGQQRWPISPEQADRLLDEPLPVDLALATASTRGPAVCYVLPDGAWIVLARHEKNQFIPVFGEVGWGYSGPVLTYCTELEDRSVASGYINLLDQPTPAHLKLYPGTATKAGPLTEVQITEEDYRLSLAIAQHFRPA